MAAVIVGVLACVGAVVATSRYAGESITMTAPTWNCSGTTLTDPSGPAGDGVAPGAAPAAGQVPVLGDDMSCWGTWVLRNEGVLPVRLEDLELPVGGPGGEGFVIDAHRLDGRGESAVFAYGDPATDQDLRTAIYLDTTIEPGDTRTLGLRVVPSGAGCIEAGSTTRAPFTLTASIGPVGSGRVERGQADVANAPPDDPALVVQAARDLGACPA